VHARFVDAYSGVKCGVLMLFVQHFQSACTFI